MPLLLQGWEKIPLAEFYPNYKKEVFFMKKNVRFSYNRPRGDMPLKLFV